MDCFSTTKGKGYCKNGDNGWRAQITISGKTKHLGVFKTEDEAKDAYQKEMIDKIKSLLPENISEYKYIPRYLGRYMISQDGDILSISNSKVTKMKIKTDKHGYYMVMLSSNNNIKNEFIHRLLYETFVGEIPNGILIDHIDRNQKNNKINNLRLATKSQNMINSEFVDNAIGYSYSKKIKRWVASIGVGGKKRHIGSFKTEYEARKAYLDAKEKYHNMIMPE
jgi:hypothetical protein